MDSGGDQQTGGAAELRQRLNDAQQLLAAERDHFFSELASGAQELEDLEAQLAQQTEHLSTARAQLRASARENASLTRSLARTEAELSRTRRQLRAITGSRAYAVFRAVRKAGRVTRRVVPHRSR